MRRHLTTTSLVERQSVTAANGRHVPGCINATNSERRNIDALLRCPAAVVLQQSAQPLFATNIAERNDRLVGLVLSNSLVAPLLRFRKQFIFQPLVRPLSEIVLQVTFGYAVEMLQAKEDEVTETNQSTANFLIRPKPLARLTLGDSTGRLRNRRVLWHGRQGSRRTGSGSATGTPGTSGGQPEADL